MEPVSEKVGDPVCCCMCVAPNQHAISYKSMAFAFGSQQCKERFLANPNLFIGAPGERAPTQAGQELLKCRHLRLEPPCRTPRRGRSPSNCLP